MTRTLFLLFLRKKHFRRAHNHQQRHPQHVYPNSVTSTKTHKQHQQKPSERIHLKLAQQTHLSSSLKTHKLAWSSLHSTASTAVSPKTISDTTHNPIASGNKRFCDWDRMLASPELNWVVVCLPGTHQQFDPIALFCEAL